MSDDPISMANRYHAYMRGWKHGANVNALDPAMLARAEGDTLREAYERGYTDGRRARAAASETASQWTGYVPSVLRFAGNGLMATDAVIDGSGSGGGEV